MFFRSILSVDISLEEEEFQIAHQNAISAQPDAILISLTAVLITLPLFLEINISSPGLHMLIIANATALKPVGVKNT